MPQATSVCPGKWTNLRVLFDDGTYSVVAGDYEGDPCLGERWNGRGEDVGFPSMAGHPLWHVVPSFLQNAILHGLLDVLAFNAEAGDVQAILAQLRSSRLGTRDP